MFNALIKQTQIQDNGQIKKKDSTGQSKTIMQIKGVMTKAEIIRKRPRHTALTITLTIT